jgi:hypothetical protein
MAIFGEEPMMFAYHYKQLCGKSGYYLEISALQ